MKKIKTLRALFVVAVLVLANVAVLPHAFAATLTHSSMLETGGSSNVNPMIVGDGQEVVVDFNAVTSTTPSSISVNFNNFGNGTVASGSTTVTAGCAAYYSGATALPGSTLAATGSGTTLTLTGTLSAETSGTNYCFVFTSNTAVTNPTSAGVYSALLTVGSDSQTDAFDVLASGGNAYSLTATYAPTFTLSLSGTSDTIGALSPTSTITSTGVTATVNTNAASGWGLWAEDSNAGLTSTQNGHNIPSVTTVGSPHTMTVGSDQYALGLTADNTTNYAYGGGTTGGELSKTAFNEVASSASPASGVTTVFHELVDVSATTPPATDYTDTVTVIGAGSF